MNLLPVQYYQVVVKKQSISRAAAELHITQQTLSAHMAALEKELGCTLFLRRPHFNLTYAGRIFYRYAEQFSQLTDSLKEEFQDIHQGEEDCLSIGIAHTRGRILMPQLLPTFLTQHPHLQIQIRENVNAALLQNLQENKLDIIIANIPQTVPEICTKEFYQEKILLFIPRQLLAAEKLALLEETANLSLLRSCPFLLGPVGDIASRIGTTLLLKSGIVPRVRITAENIETLLELCVQGLGACFCPALLAQNILSKTEQNKLAAIPIDSSYPIHLAWQNKAYTKKSIQNFLDFCLTCSPLVTGIPSLPASMPPR